ncbi:MAG: PD40 domain-containing protein [Nitrospirae bacterium]|nr:PD40 domain-containing protein [Nitrospirota bacterium]
MYKQLSVIIFFIIVVLFNNLINYNMAYGFGSSFTHPSITRLAVDNVVTIGEVDRLLKHELDIQDGIDSTFLFLRNVDITVPDKEIERNNDVVGSFGRVYPSRFDTPYTGRYLVISGSEAEDHPTERAQHHFLDPISNKGLDNNYYGAGVLADFLALFYPSAEQGNVGRLFCSLLSMCESSFNLDGTPAVDRVEGKSSASYPYNYFAWPDTRRYFYNALTAATKEERGHYFAMTFFSLGHNLHILEDMGVPAHTRNDFLYDHIWHGVIQGAYLEGYLESGKITELIPPPLTGGGEGEGEQWIFSSEKVSFSRVADFWDNNGTNQRPGMAEYTNQNFLSEGTVFSQYDKPDWISIETYEHASEDGKRDLVQYYRGMTSDGMNVPHLAAVGLLHSKITFLTDKDKAKYTAHLDPYSYKDYSEILIPKAVSYVSALMEFFFRGRIAVLNDGADGVRIKNMSAEPLNNGSFEILYDSTSGTRNKLASYAIPANTSIPSGGVTEKITFNKPADNTSQDRFVVVYKGRLGEEDNAVIGKVVKKNILFVSNRTGSSAIYSMDAENSVTRLLVPNDNPSIDYTHPVASSDGKAIAFYSNRDGSDSIWIMDTRTSSLIRITEGSWPDWSPDGRQLVYSRKTNGKGDIFIFDTESLVETRLTFDNYNNLYPAWSPDGASVAYTSQRETKNDIIVVDLNTHNALNLTASIDNLDRWKPAWSPDGKMIAYEKPTKIVFRPDEPFYVNIYSLDIDTGIETNLTNVDSNNKSYGVWNGTPRWMNNNSLIIESNVSGDAWSDLWLIDGNGAGFMKRLTDTPGHDGYPFVW